MQQTATNKNQNNEILLKEYELTLNHLDSIDNRIFQLMTIAFGAIAFIIGYMITQRPDFTKPDIDLLRSWLVGSWLVPSLCLTVYATLIFQVYLLLGRTFNARILSLRINKIVEEAVLQQFEPMTVHGQFFSTKTGSPKLRILYTILFVSLALLYPAIVFLAFDIIYQQQSHLAATLFIILYSSLGLLLFFAASGLINDFPQAHDKFLKDFDGSQPIPYFDGNQPVSSKSPVLIARPPISTAKVAKAILASAFPRPADIIMKGPFFVYGFAIASIITGLNGWHLRFLNTLFGEASSSWKNVAAVPIWAIIALCLIYFIVEEILLQQAKLIWDDIRDHERDKDLLHNKRRAIASGQMSLSSAKWQLVVRLLTALIFGYILGNFALLSVFLLICLHQAFYVLWAKPRSARDYKSDREQRELLFFLSFNSSLRFLAGIVSVAGSAWALSPYILFYTLFYFCSFGALAAFWKMEAKHYENDLAQYRPQSQYYLHNGRFWQYVGLLAAVFVGASMVITQVLALSCIPVISEFYGGCTAKGGVFHYVDYGLLGILLVLILIVLFGGISWGLVYLFRPIGDTIAKLVKKVKPILTNLFFIGTVVVLLLLLPLALWNSVFLLFLGFFLLNAGYFFMYEGMTYEQYTNTDFWKRLPNIKKATGYFLFEADKNIGLRRLIQVANSNTDPDTWKNQKNSSTTPNTSP